MSENAASIPRLLWTGPPGSGKTQRALEAIREAATVPGPRGRAAAAPEEALLILPTYAQVLHVKRLALSRWDARGILDLPFTTFTAAGERFLPGFRVRQLPTADERDRLMQAAMEGAAPKVFERVAGRAGFRAHLLRLVKESKQTGDPTRTVLARLAKGAEALAPSASERLEGFVEVFRAYEALLEEASLEDHEDALRRLLTALESGEAMQPPRLLVIDAFDDFTPAQDRIVVALADRVTESGGHVRLTLPYDPDRKTLFAGAEQALMQWRRRGFEEEPLHGFPRTTAPALTALATRLFADERPRSAPQPSAPDDGLSVHVAGDAEAEAEDIARQALDAWTRGVLPSGGRVRGWRDIGIVVRRLHAETAARFRRAFDAVGIPLRVIGAGEPLAATAPMRALHGLVLMIEAIADPARFDAGRLLDTLRYAASARNDTESLRALDETRMRYRQRGFPERVDEVLSASPEGLQDLREGLEALRTRLAGAEDPLEALGQTLPQLLPVPLAGGLDKTGRPRDLTRDKARVRVLRVMQQLSGIIDGLRRAAARTGLGAPANAGAAARMLWERIEETRVQQPDPRLDAVSLLDVEEARFWELPLVFVAAFEEGQFPLHPREDVILRDHDRERLAEADDGVSLPLARDKEGRERRLALVALTRARSQLVLSRAAYGESGNAVSESVFWRDVRRLVAVETSLKEAVPGRVVPHTLRTDADILLHAAAAAGGHTGHLHGPQVVDPTVARTWLAARAPGVVWRAARALRAAAEPLAEDGTALRTVEERFEARSDVFSVSRLGRMLRCPHEYFLGEVLRIPGDAAPFAGPQFDALYLGTLLHSAAELAVRHPNRAPEALAKEAVGDDAPQGWPEALLLEEAARVIHLLRDRERAHSGGFAPLQKGLEFGFGGRDDEAPPVALGTRTFPFRLRGRVDRVDGAGSDVLLVDYKSGVSSVDRGAQGAAKGVDPQLPLYARALEQLWGVKVVGLEWVALRSRWRRGMLVEQAVDSALARAEGAAPEVLEGAAFRARLTHAENEASRAAARVTQGLHLKAPGDPGLCASCRYQSACRPGRVFPDQSLMDEVLAEEARAFGLGAEA